MTKIIAILIAAFFAVTASASNNASTVKTGSAANVQTHKVMKRAEVQKSKKKKKTHKHKKSKKAAATPAAGQ